ncbi:MAG: DUF480 domain-containing protein [Planctomycetaceae bacterium]|nr:DUF480 domain-containing protein [Planctomycetaceae bacterium]
MESSSDQPNGTTPSWRPLSARQRRVLGTLIEKSKTTPDAYPLTMLALTTGCNQKSNRNPINNYSQEQIEETVEYLKGIGAVALVQGNGRVPKVRHYAYQWLGLSKVEAAVMTELLLRGEQTLGELRTRASRMEPIADLAELQKLLADLHTRKLIQFLTPAGRGQLVSHNLYPDSEKSELVQKYANYSGHAAEPCDDSDENDSDSPQTKSTSRSAVAELKAIVDQLQERVKFLEDQLGTRWSGPE